ncbi:MAG: GDSL-type esterase/lipase family protein [Bdellovibrionota bacterium]
MFFRLSLLVFAILFSVSTSVACPTIEELIDFNCNQDGKISVTGDSFVNGVGDTRNQAGYVGRAENNFSEFRFSETGVNGVTTSRLLSNFKRFFPRGKTTYKRTNNSDIIVIDVGRNDYWSNISPAIGVRNIKRLVKYLRKATVNDDADAAPEIFVATLMPTSRGFQAPFIREFNRLLLKQKGKKLPVYIRFDKLPINIVGSDGLHPTARGYKRAAGFLTKFLKGRAQTLMAKKRADTDSDGIYDFFETNRYGTDPEVADTDGDTHTDGDEIFTLESDPLDPADPTA